MANSYCTIKFSNHCKNYTTNIYQKEKRIKDTQTPNKIELNQANPRNHFLLPKKTLYRYNNSQPIIMINSDPVKKVANKF